VKRWIEEKTGSIVAVWDLFTDPIPDILQGDMLYIDPPWDMVWLKKFNIMAGKEIRVGFEEYLSRLFQIIDHINPQVLYMEWSVSERNAWRDRVIQEISKRFKVVQRWRIRYGARPNMVIRGGARPINIDITGVDDNIVPYKVISHERPKRVVDFVAGLGATGLGAWRCRIPFVCTDINEKRLARLIESIEKKGGRFKNA